MSRPALASSLAFLLGTMLVLVTLLTGALATAAPREVVWSSVARQAFGTLEGSGIALNGKLYSFGGYDVTKLPNYTPTARSYVYDPATNRWTAIKDLPAFNNIGKPGITHAAIAQDGANIYLAGGYSADASGNGQIFGARDVFKYDPVADSYTRLPDLPAVRAASGMAYVNGWLYYFSGIDRARKPERAEHWALNLSNLAAGWVSKAAMPSPRNHLGAAAIDGKIYSVGGGVDQDQNSTSSRVLNRYDPATNAWSTLAPLPVALSHTVATVLDGQLVVLGGQTAYNKNVAAVYGYDPATDTWAAYTSLPLSRFAGVVGTINGAIYYSGGSNDSATFKGTPKPLPTTPPTQPTQPTTPPTEPTTPPPSGTSIRIDAGSGVATTDAAGRTWQADTGLFTPSSVAPGGSSTTAIAGTSDDAIFGTNRSNMGNATPLASRFFDYAIPTSATKVDVKLLFSESYWTAVNKRRFDVYAEGAKLISNLDLFAAAGAKDTAVTRTLPGVTVTGGVLDLRFQALADFPIISGIEVTCTAGCGTTEPPTEPEPFTPQKVNFQPAGAPVPAGYTVDRGEPFSVVRGSGWVRQDSLGSSHVALDLTLNTRDRNVVADQRLDTFIHMQGTPGAAGLNSVPGGWELAVPIGTYTVTVAAGDPSYTDSRHTVRVEGTPAIDGFVPTSAVKSRTATVTVPVTDGRLTIDAIGGANTKLAYVTVDPA